MRTIRVLTAVLALGGSSSACRGGLVAPGRTAGDTWGGAWSARFAPKKEEAPPAPKKEKAKTFPPGAPGPHDRPGFITRVQDGRLWIFRDRTKDLTEFDKGGEPPKMVTLVGEGPDGMTLRGPDLETIQAWQFSRPGFEVWVRDGRLWVAKPESLDALWLRTGGELGKNATLVGEGPQGMSVRAGDLDTARAYVAAVRN